VPGRKKKRNYYGSPDQKLETKPYLVAYLLKKLDGSALGWPGCLKAIATTSLLVEEAMKRTLGQQLEVLTPHQVRVNMELKSHLWVSGERFTKYQGIPLESPEVTIKTSSVLSPASLLSSELVTEHNCEQMIVQTYASRPDLTDKPLLKHENKWFTDGSSFMLNVLNGKKKKNKEGCAVASHEVITEIWPLPTSTSAQKAE
jgi:hypothetical protein